MTPAEFEQYRHQAVHDLMDLNEKCENGFRLADWPRWSYDLDGATLVFLRDGIPRVIVGVQLAGTASADESTWTWGWADTTVPRKVVAAMDGVREFGGREGIDELSRGTLAADGYTGWEMTAVAARILGAKGAYRCPSPAGGTLYFVYQEITFAPPPESATVECTQHGRGFPAYVCEHLIEAPAQPWFSQEPTPADRWPDAWCAACDAIYLEEGEWNERTSRRIRIKTICHRCYESKRNLAISVT